MTAEDKKLILEWCGFKPSILSGEIAGWQYPDAPNPEEERIYVRVAPIPDLNFYFKYAVPKLKYANIQFSNQYSDVVPQFSATVSIQFADNHTWADNDPAEAFGQALLKLIKERGKRNV